MGEKSIDERKKDKQYLEIATSKNIKQVLNIIDSIIEGQRFANSDTKEQMYLLDCQSRIQEMMNNRFTEADIVFIINSINSLTKVLFSAKDELEDIIY